MEEEEDDWGPDLKFYRTGFFKLKRDRALPESDARSAVVRHMTYLGSVDPIKLLLFLTSKKEKVIIEFLYRNASATMSDLYKLTDADISKNEDTLRRSINRLNDKFLENGIRLEILKENGNSSRPGKDRVWLDVCS